MNSFDRKVLDKIANTHSQLTWDALEHYYPYNEMSDTIEEAVKLARLELLKKIEQKKKEIRAVKTTMKMTEASKETALILLDELCCFLQEKEEGEEK